MRLVIAFLTLLFCPPLVAQVVPDLPLDNPRVQSIRWEEGQQVLLTVMPSSGLTVMLETTEVIERVVSGDQNAFQVQVTPEANSFLILPRRSDGAARVAVTTNKRDYDFMVRTGTGLTAAYLVRFTYDDGQSSLEIVNENSSHGRWSYRLRGDRDVLPVSVHDDAVRTFITYGPEQALPAVFAIGPTGAEETVNGYMRGERFVIDRVYSELVFRIDDERASARRNDESDIIE